MGRMLTDLTEAGGNYGNIGVGKNFDKEKGGVKKRLGRKVEVTPFGSLNVGE